MGAPNLTGVPAVPTTMATTSTWMGRGYVAPSTATMKTMSTSFDSTLDVDFDSLTIGSLTSSDTIPLGTDLDPQNYCNHWAASKVGSQVEKQLVRCNLQYRVIDAENVGFSYGLEVLKKVGHYDPEGVRRAVSHFLQQGLRSVVVSKRKDMLWEDFGDDTCIIIAELNDDVILLKEASKR